MEVVLLVTLFFLLVMSGVASAIETAITGSNFIKIETLAEKGNKKAKKALFLQDKQQRVLSTMLFLNNVVNISASTVTTILVTTYIKSIPLAIATAILTFVILIFCEITPKRIANKNSEPIVIVGVDFIKFVLKIFYPIVNFLSKISDIVAGILRINLVEEQERYTEEEIKTLVDISHEQGVIETDEKEIIQNALEFGDRTLREVMVTIDKVSYINVNDSYEEVINKFINNEYTRYPVIDGSVDNVVGILNIKDFVKLQKIGKENYNLKEIMREPFFLGESVKISSAFRRMQKVLTNIVIVREANCKTIGIATLEDILEEIVGEIRDEFDEHEYM